MRIAAWLARKMHPQLGYCFGCGYPWSHVEPRTVWYDEGRGCFALCVGCWRERTVSERVEAHDRLVAEWWHDLSLLPQVQRAVRNASMGERFASLDNLGNGT